MIFEPYNLDNSAIIFHDGPHAGHGVRYITKDVERRAIQIYLEEYSPETGLSVLARKPCLLSVFAYCLVFDQPDSLSKRFPYSCHV